MATRHFFRRNATPTAAGILAAAISVYPKTVHAEAPEREEMLVTKKPIYDENPPTLPMPQSSSSPESSNTSSPNSSSSEGSSLLSSLTPSSLKSSTDESKQSDEQTPSVPTSQTPTPTDRLSTHVRQVRLSLYNLSLSTEDALNRALTRTLNYESNLANTLYSLAPPPSANEPLLPGSIYILVATLSGTILTRSRSFPLRLVIPTLFGLGAAQATLPVTCGNVRSLVWEFETKRVPGFAKRHREVEERVERFLATGREHAGGSVEILKGRLEEGRKGVEEWVKKGR